MQIDANKQLIVHDESITTQILQCDNNTFNKYNYITDHKGSVNIIISAIIETLISLLLTIFLIMLGIYTIIKAIFICYIWRLLFKLNLDYTYDNLGIRKDIIYY